MRIALIITISYFLFSQTLYPVIVKPISQDGRKSLVARRVTEAPRIDGDLSDIAWKDAPVAGDFVQYSPYSGQEASYSTEVRLLYDDEAIYISAIMYDAHPDSIYSQLGKRDSDNDLNADHFYIDISTFNDGLNGETFKISASGVQSDMKARSSDLRSYGGGDRSWDGVWFSGVSINENGWAAELKIPYSALRFPKTDNQVWGINFWRELRRNREISSWNFVDREAGSNFNHLGELTGLDNLVPPVRLSFTPYLSGYYEKYDGEKSALRYNGGLDLKYGINESFTLDATLIPDFGQVQSDDQVLNLTPYEVKFNEKRPFFMEGTELFNKGDIFYSRRIGARPGGYYSVYDQTGPDEVVTSNPQESSLLNATKVSGRTRSGLGIGVFNAMTRQMFAEVKDTITGNTREIKTEPFTNYNMLVLDQSLRNGSYFSVANTNVWRANDAEEDYYTANVSGVDFKLQNKAKLYSVSGKAAISQKYYQADDNEFGHAYDFTAGKTGGMFRYSYQVSALSDTYDPNDMGYLRRNNELRNMVTVSYNTFEPFWRIYTTRNSLSYSYNQLYNPRVFTGSTISLNSMTIFDNYWSLNIRSEYNPVGEDDYYEPRVSGYYFHRPSDISLNIRFDTDKSRKYYFEGRGEVKKFWSDYDQRAFSLAFQPEVKLSSRSTVGMDLGFENSINDIGFVDHDSENGNIIFGTRDNRIISVTFNTEYIFTPNSYLTFRLRHYWARADYNDRYYFLREDGGLDPGSYDENPDLNYNAFNIDMVYTWRFAPGSEMTLVWKNALYDGSSEIIHSYRENIQNMFDSPMLNSLSIKILYYLDYQSLRKRN